MVKTISVSDANWDYLMKKRIELKLKNLNEVIEKLIKKSGESSNGKTN